MAEAEVRSVRDLRVWQAGIELVTQVYAVVATFPPGEQCGLSSQMRRAAVSVPASIAEGHPRQGTREYLRHVSIAAGSLAELETQIEIAARLGYIDAQGQSTVLTATRALGRQLGAPRSALQAAPDAAEPRARGQRV